LKPVITTYQKNLSSEEILLAQYRLKSEQINLMEATRLAELLASSSDAFKVMLEEQRRRSDVLKAMSKYRLLWIKAIDRVLRQNFIEKVKSRLFKSSIADWFRTILDPDARIKARIEAVRIKQTKDSKSHKKKGRRSLDNSELPGLKPKANNKETGTPQSIPLQATTKLPEINPYHTPGVNRVRKNATRRTFDSAEHKVGLNNGISMPYIAFDPDAVPPSIAQSFVEIESKPLAIIVNNDRIKILGDISSLKKSDLSSVASSIKRRRTRRSRM